MKHVIITRFGLARLDEAFYREHLRLCSLTLAPSLRAQSSKKFIWAVAIDKRAPEWVDDAIRQLTPGIDVRIWRIDPLVDGLNPVDVEALERIARGDAVITSRVDDDDLLHRDFVRRTRSELKDATGVVYLTYGDGLIISRRTTEKRRSPWIGLGLSCLSSAPFEDQAYRYSHSRTGVEAARDGHEVREISTPEPMWIRTYRATSDSAEPYKGTRIRIGEATSVDPRLFGLSKLGLWRLRRALREAEAAPTRSGITRPKAQPRLFMKSEILRTIEALRMQEPEPKETIEALAAALYSF